MKLVLTTDRAMKGETVSFHENNMVNRFRKELALRGINIHSVKNIFQFGRALSFREANMMDG